AKPGLVPVACKSRPTVATVVTNDRTALTAPGPVGAKLTGTDSDWPVWRVTGSVGGVTPNGAVVEMPEIVRLRLAVTVAVPRPVVPTGTEPMSTGEPTRAEFAGRPNASSRPSRVPT